MDKLRSMI